MNTSFLTFFNIQNKKYPNETHIKFKLEAGESTLVIKMLLILICLPRAISLGLYLTSVSSQYTQT